MRADLALFVSVCAGGEYMCFAHLAGQACKWLSAHAKWRREDAMGPRFEGAAEQRRAEDDRTGEGGPVGGRK